MPGVYGNATLNNTSIPKNLNSQKEDGLKDFIANIYQFTAKPYKIHTGILWPDGSVTYDLKQSEAKEYKSGYPFVETIITFKDKRVDVVEQYYLQNGVMHSMVSQNATDIPEVLEADALLYVYNKMLEASKTPDLIELPNEIQFKEKAMSIYAKDYIQNYTFKNSVEQFCKDFKIEVDQFSNFTYDGDQTYNKDDLLIDLAYKTIDGVGLALSVVNLDVVPDAVGAIIAYTTGDNGMCNIYLASAGISVILNGQAYKAAAKEALKGGKIYVKGMAFKLAGNAGSLVKEENYVISRMSDFLHIPANLEKEVDLTKFWEMYEKQSSVVQQELLQKIIAEKETSTKIKLINNFLNISKSDKILLLAKIDNYTNLKTWVTGLNETADAAVITKLHQLPSEYLTMLEADLVSNGNEIKSLLKTPDDVDIWQTLKDDPAYAFSLGEEGQGNWGKWAKGNFFKTVTKAGKDFENIALNELKATSSTLIYCEWE
jgi:hypothetical protein